jgi:hypothetical protein
MKTKIVAATLLALLANSINHALAGTQAVARADDVFVIKADGLEWRFVAVEGTSQLPLDYMRTGDEPAKTNLVTVTMPKFWIAEKMVTEGEFAALMGRKVRDGRTAEQHLADIEWEDALHYCEKFTTKYSKELPANTFASMPTMHEWSHAVNVLEGKLDLSDAVGTFLFTMNQFAGVIVTSDAFESQKDADFDLAVDLGILPKRVSQSFIGLRMVLVSWNGGQLIAGNEHIDNRVLSRGSVLTTYGLWEDAERHLKQAIAKGALSPDDKSRAEGMLEFIGQEHEYEFEDWSGLVSRAAEFAEKKGYAVRPYTESWQWLEYEGGKERPEIVAEYGKAGIVGEWIKIGNLPEAIKKDQPVGTEGHIMIFHNDDQKSFPYTYTVTDSNLVQVLRCDFTGDGIEDMVVEDFLSVGSGGYWYTFYEATEDGGFKKVDSDDMHEGVQLVGLCAIPRIDGKGCGFIVIGKESNPVLTASILSVKDGKFVWDTVTGKSVYMLDAKADAIYMPAPFIGAGYGIGFRLLEGQGTWYRPVFWPWEQGKVQGFEQAQKEAVQLKQKAQKELVKLREKWPHAADRVSQWDMPDYEKRFFEIDKLQDWCGEDKPNRYGKFESLCREAIGMKIEPAIWYYNLACALSVQGKTDDAFDALEQAVVAGYNESYKAKADSDFDNISANPRFSELLAVMDVWDRGNWNAPREYASVSNGVVVLSEDKVYYGFKNHYYSVWLDGLRDTLFYIDRDGQDDSIDDVVTVRFDAIGRSKKRDIGFANLVIGNRPLIARGTCRDGELPSDSLGALGASFSNVLGLYACDDYPFGKLIWCILYRGGAAEGRRLAEIIRDAYRAMPTEERERMLAGGLFAREMTSMIHDSMKPGTDGGVITVSDIDVPKLMTKATSLRVASFIEYTVQEDDDIIAIAIRLGVSPEDIRKLNGLKPSDVLKPGTVLKIPQ